MTGDGVNDAPALRRADIGFAMGSGTEVAKEAGDIVILDDNLLSIAKAVRYGRTIFKSIRKFIIFQLNLNFCALGVSVIAPLIGVDTPITVIQMLWINMVMDTLAGLAFGGEPALMEYMREPPKKRNESIVNRYMAREIILSGIYGVAMCLWFLKSQVTAALFPGHARFMTAFFALFMFMGIFQSLNARTHRLNLFDHLAANKPFLGIMGLVAAVQTALIYFGGTLFRANGLTAWQLIFVLFAASTAMLARSFRVIWYEHRGLSGGT
jgi:magnesium-transporting ATPase (P-type)